MSLNWEPYYEEAWHAYMGYTIYCIASVLLFVILAHTCYSIYGTKKDKSGRKHASDTNVPTPLAILTILVVSNSFLYAFAEVVFKTLNMALEVWTPCRYEYLCPVFVGVQRFSMACLFAIRLHSTFAQSVYAYPIWLLPLVLSLYLVCFGYANYYYFAKMWASYVDYEKISDDCLNLSLDRTAINIPYISVDFLFTILLLGLFLNQLVKLVHQMQDSSGSTDSGARKRLKEMVRLIAKLTILVGVAYIGTWVFYAVMGPLSGGGPGIAMDGVLNSICCVMCYHFYQTQYHMLCAPCRFLCTKCCMYCVIGCHASKTKENLEHNLFGGRSFSRRGTTVASLFRGDTTRSNSDRSRVESSITGSRPDASTTKDNTQKNATQNRPKQVKKFDKVADETVDDGRTTPLPSQIRHEATPELVTRQFDDAGKKKKNDARQHRVYTESEYDTETRSRPDHGTITQVLPTTTEDAGLDIAEMTPQPTELSDNISVNARMEMAIIPQTSDPVSQTSRSSDIHHDKDDTPDLKLAISDDTPDLKLGGLSDSKSLPPHYYQDKSRAEEHHIDIDKSEDADTRDRGHSSPKTLDSTTGLVMH